MKAIKTLTILAAIGALGACTTETASAPYRPMHSDAQWLIDGSISPMRDAAFYVNGELAVKGSLGYSGGILHGEYKDHPVSVDCTHSYSGSGSDRCDVYVDAELATRLTFAK